MKLAAVIEALVAQLGPSHVFTDPADVMARDQDGRGPVGQALVLVRPGTVAEVWESSVSPPRPVCGWCRKGLEPAWSLRSRRR